jgi:hypothetical protein
VVEGAALEKQYALTGIVGSNPTLSARRKWLTFMVGHLLLAEAAWI